MDAQQMSARPRVAAVEQPLQRPDVRLGLVQWSDLPSAKQEALL
jgi:hypothetical protein